MKCQAIMNIMEQLAPRRLAEDWDNPGLLVGSPKQDVGKLLVCLDVTEEVVMEAVYNALNAHNIEIPFPQRDIHIIQETSKDDTAGTK